MMNTDNRNQGGRGETEAAGAGPPSQPRPPALPMTIEGPRAEVAKEIGQLSPEGQPADAKSGPGMLAMEVGLAFIILTIAAITMGLWLGWSAGIAVFAIAVTGLLFNPAAIAALARLRERKTVADRHRSGRRVVVVHKGDFDHHST